MNRFAARYGNKRMYPNSASAVAYERAYMAYPIAPWGPSESPAMDGYRDAKAAAELTAASAATEHAASFTEHRETTCAA